MNIRKRICTLLLSLCTAVILAVSGWSGAYAAEAPDEKSSSFEFHETGVTLTLPPEFEKTTGVIVPYGGYDITGGVGLYASALLYFAIDQENYDKYVENTSPTQEEYEAFWNSSAFLVMILSADNGMTFDEMNVYAEGTLNDSNTQKICTCEDCTHYLYDTGEVLPEDTDPVFLEEFESLKDLTEELLTVSEFRKPVNPTTEMIGRKIVFETTDTEGNPVKSEELFGSHEITMVNIWASWCGYCIDEMEELEAVNGRLSEKDCAVVGLLSDGNEEGPLASGKAVLKDKKVTYVNLLPPENLDDIFYIEAYPTTYFVNREGVVIGTPIIGARIDQYEPMVEALLAEDESAVRELLEEDAGEETDGRLLAARVETNDDSLYRVIVIDENEKPVPGVMVQFCSDTACMAGETDETGTAVFEEPVGRYTVHILTAPEGYTVDEVEYFLEAFADLTIYLYRE